MTDLLRWSSGYGSCLVIRRLWVRILVGPKEYFSEHKNINRQALCLCGHIKVRVPGATIARKNTRVVTAGLNLSVS